MPRILLAPSLALAESLPTPEVTIEAEYGSVVVKGSRFTAAHHQREGQYSSSQSPSPCNNREIPVIPSSTEEVGILISHLDLDTIGGCLRALGRWEFNAVGDGKIIPDFKNLFENTTFWSAAEFVDLNGPHKKGSLPVETQERLAAFWAYSKSMPRLPRDTVSDVTEVVQEAGRFLRRLLCGTEEEKAAAIQMGRDFLAQERALNEATYRFVASARGVMARVTDDPKAFLNALYTTPDGSKMCAAVVAHNRGTGAITLSLADPLPGVSCRDIAQALWGSEAGGHPGIAGSPRGKVMAEEDFTAAIEAMVAAIDP